VKRSTFESASEITSSLTVVAIAPVVNVDVARPGDVIVNVYEEAAVRIFKLAKLVVPVFDVADVAEAIRFVIVPEDGVYDMLMVLELYISVFTIISNVF
jgi:hypothetical protein